MQVDLICDGYVDCDNGADESNCAVTNTTLHTCTLSNRRRYQAPRPILNNTRCGVFDEPTVLMIPKAAHPNPVNQFIWCLQKSFPKMKLS